MEAYDYYLYYFAIVQVFDHMLQYVTVLQADNNLIAIYELWTHVESKLLMPAIDSGQTKPR